MLVRNVTKAGQCHHRPARPANPATAILPGAPAGSAPSNGSYFSDATVLLWALNAPVATKNHPLHLLAKQFTVDVFYVLFACLHIDASPFLVERQVERLLDLFKRLATIS